MNLNSLYSFLKKNFIKIKLNKKIKKNYKINFLSVYVGVNDEGVTKQ